MIHRLLIAISVLAALSCSGSGGGKAPSESQGRQAFVSVLDSGRTTHVRLVSFKKTDGQLAVVEGVQSYNFEFEAELEFLDSGPFSLPGSFFDPNLDWKGPPAPEVIQQAGGTLAGYCRALDNNIFCPTMGQRGHAKGAVLFGLKESGWQPQNLRYDFKLQSVAPPPPPSSETMERAYISSMRSDLYNLETAQQSYFSEHGGSFAPSVDALGSNYAPSPSVKVTIFDVTGTGWSATAAHPESKATCTIVVQTGSATAPTPICH